VARAAENLPEKFDLSTAVGDQLTLLGKRLGWARCHCVCDVQPVFGFECEGQVSIVPIAGFCQGNVTWINCGPSGFGDICITDDETYRKFLYVRCYQMLSRYDLASLETCLRILWGDNAMVLAAGEGRIVIAPGRDLMQDEVALLQLFPRVLPIAPGIEVRFHFGPTRVFGFGEGWGGFCEPWVDNAELGNGDGDEVGAGDGDVIGVGSVTRDAHWMCEIDVRPYGCP